MTSNDDRTDLPVLLLYNIDPKWTPEETKESFQDTIELKSALCKLGHPVTPLPIYNTDLVTPLREYDPQEHIVFNWCEGVPGIPNSYAHVAQTLEEMDFAYTGSPPDVLALSQDKPQVKELLAQHHIATPGWRVYDSAQANGWKNFPAIVKPAQEHCSFGISSEAVVSTPDELHNRVAYVLDTFHQPALVEEFIDGPEFHITLWGNEPPEMLPPVEVDFAELDQPQDRICSYDFKFRPGTPHYEHIWLAYSELDKDQFHQLEQASLATYQATGCRDYARLDIRLRDGTFYVLDVNPNAGISQGGSVSWATKMAGYSYGEMGSRLVNLAAQRHPILGAEQGPLSS